MRIEIHNKARQEMYFLARFNFFVSVTAPSQSLIVVLRRQLELV